MALCVRFALPFAIAYASIQPHRQSHNNIMLSIQHHSNSEKELKPCSCQRYPPWEPTHPPTLSAEQKKNKLWFCFLPCACGRFIHFIHSFVIRSVTLRIAPFHFTTSSLLHSVHFTHLSTAHKSSSISQSKNPPAMFRSAIRLLQALTQANAFCINTNSCPSRNAILCPPSVATLVFATAQ